MPYAKSTHNLLLNFILLHQEKYQVLNIGFFYIIHVQKIYQMVDSSWRVPSAATLCFAWVLLRVCNYDFVVFYKQQSITTKITKKFIAQLETIPHYYKRAKIILISHSPLPCLNSGRKQKCRIVTILVCYSKILASWSTYSKLLVSSCSGCIIKKTPKIYDAVLHSQPVNNKHPIRGGFMGLKLHQFWQNARHVFVSHFALTQQFYTHIQSNFLWN